MVVTGNGGLGFDSGEGAWETATISKEHYHRDLQQNYTYYINDENLYNLQKFCKNFANFLPHLYYYSIIYTPNLWYT